MKSSIIQKSKDGHSSTLYYFWILVSITASAEYVIMLWFDHMDLSAKGIWWDALLNSSIITIVLLVSILAIFRSQVSTYFTLQKFFLVGMAVFAVETTMMVMQRYFSDYLSSHSIAVLDAIILAFFVGVVINTLILKPASEYLSTQNRTNIQLEILTYFFANAFFFVLFGEFDFIEFLHEYTSRGEDHEAAQILGLGVTLIISLRIFSYKHWQYANKLLFEVQHLSNHDHLTGLYNRRYFDKTLTNEATRTRRGGNSFSVILLDIDDFKRVNDTYGHKVGDEYLVQLSQLLRSNTRKTDIISRWGGEEFIILCPGIDLAGTEKLASKLLEAVRSTQLGSLPQITVSAGITTFNHKDDIATVVKRADGFLYDAKTAGKNRFVAAEGPCSGLIEPDTLIRDNIYQILRCQNGTETSIQTVF